VLVKYNPWLQVVGADSPVFALYQDGTAIYRDTAARAPRSGFSTVHLDATEWDALFRHLGSLRDLVALDTAYQLVTSTDQPTNELSLWVGERVKRIAVYGYLDDPRAPARGTAPRSFLRAFDALRRFASARATPWRPPRAEVMIWPFEYATIPSVSWPPGWPTLTSSDTRIRHKTSYSLFVDSARFDSLNVLVRQLGIGQPLLLARHKWAMAVRFPFPAESLWMTYGHPE
jgi:hypothetical protein